MLYGIITVIFILACLGLIISVLAQSGKSAGLSGSIGGGAEQIWGKNKANSYQDLFDKMTKASAVVFMICAVVLSIIQ